LLKKLFFSVLKIKKIKFFFGLLNTAASFGADAIVRGKIFFDVCFENRQKGYLYILT
jgi:hypothetical protein